MTSETTQALARWAAEQRMAACVQSPPAGRTDAPMSGRFRGPWKSVRMSESPATRYEAAQIVEAVDRARGDGRYFLVRALLELDLPVEQSEDVLAQVLEKELRPDECEMVLVRLARLRPTTYLPKLIETGLRSHSINVQQMTIAVLPDLVGEGLSPALGEQVEGWLRRRLANPRRGGSWATWEIPDAARALMPSYGTERVIALLSDIEPKMQPEEQDMWRTLKQAVGDRGAFQRTLGTWSDQNKAGSIATGPREPRDPTAELSVDRAMRRLGHRPANPESQVYDSLADFNVTMNVFALRGDREPSEDPD